MPSLERPVDPLMPEVPVTFKTKVNLVSIPVVARDAQGRAVGNLTREDFQLFDNGKPQVISRFSVEKFEKQEAAPPVPVPLPAVAPQAAPPPAMPERYVAYVFDDVNTRIEALAPAREAAFRHMVNSLRPTERAAVYTTSGEGGIDFTDDRDKLRKAVLAIRPQNAIAQAECPPITIYQADMISKGDVFALGAAMADYIGCGGHAENAEWHTRNAARAVVALADRNNRTVLASLNGIIKKLSLMAGRRTVVLVSSGFLMLDDRRADESAMLERAVRAGIIVNSLDARALWALAPGLDASTHTVDNDIDSLPALGPSLIGGSSGSGGSSLLVKNQMARQEAFAARDVMAEIAANTGGRFFENSNDLADGYERLATAPEYIYMLGFEPQNLKIDGKYHSLKVTLRNSPGIALEARRGYYAPRTVKSPAEESKQELEEAFFSRAESREIPVSIQTQVSKTSRDKATISVHATIEVRQLSYHKEADRNRNDVTVITGIFDRDGNYIKGTQKVLELRLRNETLAGRNALAVNNSFSVPPGKYMVRLVVRDSEGQSVTSQSTAVEVP